MANLPAISRLEALFIPEPNSGCWLWLGHIKSNGYGTLGVKMDGAWKTMHAHRICYEVHVGAIPKGSDLDHRCRLRCCVNPDHLEPVSRSENLARSPLMNRQTTKTCCPLGHQYSGINSRGQRICRECLNAAARRSHNKRKNQ